MKVGFLGAGNMGEALARGAVEGQIVAPGDLYIFDVLEERRRLVAAELAAKVAETPESLVAAVDVVFFAVKPQNMPELMAHLAANRDFRRALVDRLFISICAGITTRAIERGIQAVQPNDTTPDNKPRVVRVMPNTPALIRMGASAVARGRNASREDVRYVMDFFSAVGIAVEVEESLMDAVTALSGSGPAYVFRLIEALERAGVAQGLEPHVARELTLQTVAGAARMALKQIETPTEELRRRVTSPGGTTAAGIAALEAGGFEAAVAACVAAAANRGKELGAGKT